MEITLNERDMIEFIKKYYKQYENRDVQVTVSAQKEWLGYGLGEYEGCITTVKITDEVELLGVKSNVTERLSERQVTDIFDTLLTSEGYSVKRLTYDAGLTTSYEGAYMNEIQLKKSYFNGVKLEVEKVKAKEKVKK